METILSPNVRKALAVDTHHWGFQFIGYGEAPTKPTRMGGWVVTTVKEVPDKAKERILALKAAGVPITDVIVAHEAPRLLKSPAPKPTVPPIVTESQKESAAEPKRVTVGLGDTLGEVLGMMFQVFAMMLFLPLLLVDPAVIVRLPTGEMILVTTYLEE